MGFAACYAELRRFAGKICQTVENDREKFLSSTAMARRVRVEWSIARIYTAELWNQPVLAYCRQSDQSRLELGLRLRG